MVAEWAYAGTSTAWYAAGAEMEPAAQAGAKQELETAGLVVMTSERVTKNDCEAL